MFRPKIQLKRNGKIEIKKKKKNSTNYSKSLSEEAVARIEYENPPGIFMIFLNSNYYYKLIMIFKIFEFN